jgi:hypothetical protein
MTNRTITLLILALAALSMASCSGLSAVEAGGVAVGIGASIVELAAIVSPHLSPESQAQVVELAQTSSSWMDFLGQTLAQVAQTADAATQRAAAAEANGVTMVEAAGISAVAGGGGTGLSRYFSAKRRSQTVVD